MKLNSLHDVFVDSLRDLYNAEKQLIRALPRMAKAASSPELKTAIEEHLTVTENQAHRLEQIFEELELPARGKTCPGMQGIIEEGKELISEGKDSDPDALDAALITAAQKVEHYEICGYGSARAFAETLGLSHIAEMLQETLDEESQANEQLTGLAESQINVLAMHGDGEMDGDFESGDGESNSRSRRSNSKSSGRSSGGRSKRSS
jgi:ferritin-like metal-binding protein YciE